MNKAVRQRAKYIVEAMVGEKKEADGLLGVIYDTERKMRSAYWLNRVNHMSEGQILDMYYLLTDRRQV